MRHLTVLSFLLLTACGQDAGSVIGEVVTSDSAEIQIVESLTSRWGDSRRHIEPVPLLRIGSEEEGPYQFGFLFSGRLLRDGGMAIPVPQAQEVRFFDSEGTHIRSIGGAGEGPGEFRALFQTFRFPGDSVVAFDGRNNRTTVISASTGAYRSFANQVEGNFDLFGVLGDGRSLMYSPGGSYHPELPPGLQWVATEVPLVDPADGSFRVIASLPGRQQLVEPDGNTGRVIPSLYSTQAVSDTGFYWGTPDRNEVRFYDPEGQLRRILRRRVDPTEVTPVMTQEWIDSQLEEVRRREGEEAVPRNRRGFEEAHFGEVLPFFEWAFVDMSQRLWLAAHSWPSDQGLPRLWSVFSPDGVWLGDLEAPDRVRIVDSKDDLVLGIWLDELDVPYVQVHRVVGPGSELAG